MNKARRNTISSIIERLRGCMEDLEVVRDEEREAYDNLPETIQDSDRGEAMDENADDLECACDTIDEVMDSLQEIIDK